MVVVFVGFAKSLIAGASARMACSSGEKYHSFCRHLLRSEIGKGPDASNLMLSVPRYSNHPGNGSDLPRLDSFVAAYFFCHRLICAMLHTQAI